MKHGHHAVIFTGAQYRLYVCAFRERRQYIIELRVRSYRVLFTADHLIHAPPCTAFCLEQRPNHDVTSNLVFTNNAMS